MQEEPLTAWSDGPRARLSPTIAWLGTVSLLTAMSSAMIYGLLPVFLLKVLGANAAIVGTLEGAAEAANSFMKILSGAISDRVGRRKPLLVFGYALSAFNKLLFPLADSVAVVVVARVVDRIGKGIRDAPRDAFLTDITPSPIRGSGFGLRIAFYTTGFVIGPAAAIGLMTLSGDNFRLVFAAAVVPAFLATLILLWAVQERPGQPIAALRRWPIRAGDWHRFAGPFWWWIAIASLLSLARFSQAFLVLKANAVGVDAAFVPIIVVLTHTVFAVAAYPFGVLADRLDRRYQLAGGIAVLIVAHLVLMRATSFEMTALGAMLWGLQMAVTQGLLAASVADAAPPELRGTAFGIYELAIGLMASAANVAAGALWVVGGAPLTFAAGGCAGAAAIVALLIGRPR